MIEINSLLNLKDMAVRAKQTLKTAYDQTLSILSLHCGGRAQASSNFMATPTLSNDDIAVLMG